MEALELLPGAVDAEVDDVLLPWDKDTEAEEYDVLEALELSLLSRLLLSLFSVRLVLSEGP